MSSDLKEILSPLAKASVAVRLQINVVTEHMRYNTAGAWEMGQLEKLITAQFLMDGAIRELHHLAGQLDEPTLLRMLG